MCLVPNQLNLNTINLDSIVILNYLIEHHWHIQLVNKIRQTQTLVLLISSDSKPTLSLDISNQASRPFSSLSIVFIWILNYNGQY